MLHRAGEVRRSLLEVRGWKGSGNEPTEGKEGWSECRTGCRTEGRGGAGGASAAGWGRRAEWGRTARNRAM